MLFPKYVDGSTSHLLILSWGDNMSTPSYLKLQATPCTPLVLTIHLLCFIFLHRLSSSDTIYHYLFVCFSFCLLPLQCEFCGLEILVCFHLLLHPQLLEECLAHCRCPIKCLISYLWWPWQYFLNQKYYKFMKNLRSFSTNLP